MNNLGNRIRTTRKELGMSQKALADVLNVDRVSVTQWESGRNLPNPARLELIANALEVHIEWLIAGKDCNNAEPVENNLLPNEKELLKLFRQLSGEDKKHTLKYTKDLFDLAALRN